MLLRGKVFPLLLQKPVGQQLGLHVFKAEARDGIREPARR